MEYEEKQALKIWWLYLITGVSIFPTIAILIFYKGGLSYEELEKTYFAPIFAILSPFLIIFIIQQNKLTLTISTEGISYRYFPFHTKKNIHKWINIEKAYLRKFDAFSEYGGYGVKNRLWFKLNDKAFILNDDNIGLQIEFLNGKKLLFSTNKREEMEQFLINLKTKYGIKAIQ